MQTTRPRITWKVLPMAQVAIFKEIFTVAKDLTKNLFGSQTCISNVHIGSIYYHYRWFNVLKTTAVC